MTSAARDRAQPSDTGPPSGRLQKVGRAAPIGSAAFLGVTVVSFGGPLALAALYAPTIVGDASASAGLVNIAAAAVFVVPLLVWLRNSRKVATAGGLYGFVEAAAGRRVALVHATLWIASYLLYLVYTTASIVYDVLPTVFPGIRSYQPFLEIGLPVLLAVVMLAGRTITLIVIGALAIGQLVLVGALAAVTIRHDAPLHSFGGGAPAGAISTAGAQTALLYVCGSLPLFLGGEVARPTRTVGRGLVLGYSLVAIGVVATVFPLAANPAFTRAPIPGMSVARVFSGQTFALWIGAGVAASIAGVMLVEFLALSRLLHAVTKRPITPIIRILSVILVAAAPLSLIDPDGFYDALLKPSLIALWLSQLIVFAVYPRFAARQLGHRWFNVTIAVGGVIFALYGLYATLHNTGAS